MHLLNNKENLSKFVEKYNSNPKVTNHITLDSFDFFDQEDLFGGEFIDKILSAFGNKFADGTIKNDTNTVLQGI